MRIKALLTSILLASTSIAGVASASPIVRDHRSQPTVTYQAQVHTEARPTWMSNVNYGFQVTAAGYVQPYTQGQDPIVENIPRTAWGTLASNLRLAYNQQSQLNVNVGGQRVNAIELQATGGRNWIDEVRVYLNDGKTITLPTSRFVDVVHSPNMRLDLGAQARCGVRSIEIIGNSSGKGSFNVIAA